MQGFSIDLSKLPPWVEDAIAFGSQPIIPVAALAGVVVLLLIAMLARWQAKAARRLLEDELRHMRAANELQLAEIKGGLSVMADMSAQRQSDQSRAMNDRLDALGRHVAQNMETVAGRVGQTVTETGKATSENLASLNERLAVIEDARKSLASLASEVMSLQGVLANKQARGAFGQIRMETIVRDALPPNTYEFQATLSNGKRPDCLIRLPNTPAPLVIDSKFPLEGFEALRIAQTPEATTAATRAIREAVAHHIDEIASKYLLAGETQDTALMFVPSESIYAELHERFSDLVQRAYRARIVIVAPNILMLAVQTMQAVIKDVKMRDHASTIQREVGLLLSDVTRLAERVADLERHFALSQKALEKVSVSAGKITTRGTKLGSLDLDACGPDPQPLIVTDEAASSA